MATVKEATKIGYDKTAVAKRVYEAGERISKQLGKLRNTEIQVQTKYEEGSLIGNCLKGYRSVFCFQETRGIKKRFFGLKETPILETLAVLENESLGMQRVKVKLDEITDEEILIFKKEMNQFKEEIKGQNYSIVRIEHLSTFYDEPRFYAPRLSSL